MFGKGADDYAVFQEFYEQTHSKVWLFARKHARNETLAEELLQAAYLKVWEKRHEIRPDFPAFRSYLYAVVRNLTIKEYHRLIREQDALLGFHGFREEGTVSEDSANHLSRINTALQSLPRQQKEAFRLVKMEGFTYKEAARELSISESTLEKHVSRALRRLRSKLSDLSYFFFL